MGTVELTGVRDDQDECLGSNLGSNFYETLDNAGINVEEVVTGHSRLACTRKTFRLSAMGGTEQSTTYGECRRG